MFDLHAFFDGADKLYAENRLDELEPYLLHHFAAARDGQEQQAMLAIANELIGYYRVKSNYDRCMEYADAAQELIAALGLQQTEHHGTTLLNIATAYRAAGRYAEARELYEQVLSIYRQCLPPDDMRIAGLHNNLSILYREMGDTDNALQQMQLAYAQMQKQDGHAAEQATILTNLGLMQQKAGRSEDAMASILRAIELFEHAVPYHDPHYSAALAAVAQMHYFAHDYEQAIQYYEKALAEIKRAYGENDWYRTTQNNLALVREKQKEEACG